MEVDLYGELLVEATRLGNRLFRNNVGRARYRDAQGQQYTVPYGVGGPGGSDFVGWKSVVVTPEMVGTTIAQFTACEVKSRKGKLTPAQENFLRMVASSGGCALTVRAASELQEAMCQHPFQARTASANTRGPQSRGLYK